jgi:transcriptional regulator with XRE-family HTH domain
MFSTRFGKLLKLARQQIKLSREELARRGGVSTRLNAEFERGQRPNASLETTLNLLNIVGVSVVAQAETAEMRNASTAAKERAARYRGAGVRSGTPQRLRQPWVQAFDREATRGPVSMRAGGAGNDALSPDFLDFIVC